MTWATLGDLTIEVNRAPTSLQYKEKSVFAKHQRIGGKATLQLVGEELQDISLSFRFGIGWCDPDEELKKLQDARIAANPMPLVLGNGRFSGNYLVEELGVNLQQTSPEGETQLIEVTAKLRETVDLPETEEEGNTNAEPFEQRAAA